MRIKSLLFILLLILETGCTLDSIGKGAHLICDEDKVTNPDTSEVLDDCSQYTQKTDNNDGSIDIMIYHCEIYDKEAYCSEEPFIITLFSQPLENNVQIIDLGANETNHCITAKLDNFDNNEQNVDFSICYHKDMTMCTTESACWIMSWNIMSTNRDLVDANLYHVQFVYYDDLYLNNFSGGDNYQTTAVINDENNSVYYLGRYIAARYNFIKTGSVRITISNSINDFIIFAIIII